MMAGSRASNLLSDAQTENLYGRKYSDNLLEYTLG